MPIDRPEDFFRALHPSDTTHSGLVILQRKFARALHQSQVQPKELERISKYAVGLPDIYFSPAKFSGRPLTLNFSGASCLHLQIPDRDDLTRVRLTSLLAHQGIPLPTAILTDGHLATLFWVLTKPIPACEFYIYSILQQCLHEAAKPFYPTEGNLDITFLTRLPGSINSLNNENARIPSYPGHAHDRAHIEAKIFGSNTITMSQFKMLQKQAGIVLELLALLGSRWWTNSQYPNLFQDWLIFLGSALCHFCTPNQLKQELKALAESLENKPWKSIESTYSGTIDSIAETAKAGYIKIGDIQLSINRYDWTTLIKGKLEISDQEIDELNLQVLGDLSEISPHLHALPRHVYPVGTQEFVPYQRLLLRQTS